MPILPLFQYVPIQSFLSYPSVPKVHSGIPIHPRVNPWNSALRVFRYGAASNWVTGLEVVLPTGEMVKMGSCAVSEGWQSFVPLPELAGLFLGWQGTTGVITKMAVSIWPKPKHAILQRLLFMDFEGAYKSMKALARTRIPDDIICLSYVWANKGQFIISEEQGKLSPYPAVIKGPDDPEIVLSAEVTGNTEYELNAKVAVIEELVREELKDVKLIGPQTDASTTSFFPRQAIGILNTGGGLTWVGTYGPMSKWRETIKKCC